jgi:hypothetical protein
VVINVRQTIVLVLLVSMLGGFGALVAMRQRTTHQAPAPNQIAVLPSSSNAVSSASAAASSIAAPQPSAASSSSNSQGAPSPSGSAAVADAAPVPALDRPLSVVALGWDVVAPGILANEGTKPNPKSVFAANNLDVRLTVSSAMSNVEEALARGGKDANGADVAIVSFPSFVEAYERLRALSPEVFFVVGYSRGRDALAGTNAGLPTGPTKGKVKLVGTRGAPSTFLGLFLLDIAGVAPTDVEMVVPGEREEKDAAFFAIERGDSRGESGRKIILTTADMPHFLPIVAIAPHGFITEKERAVTALAKGWLEGIKKLGNDPPGGARIIAGLEGAPEPLALLRQLGEMETATIGDNVHLMGLSGRSALTIPVLFQRTWHLYRGASFLSTPPPETLPMSTSVVTTLARSNDSLAGRDNRPSKGEFKEGKDALVVYRQEKLDEEALVNTIGLLAAVFERSVLRVSIGGAAGAVDAAKTKKVVDAAEGQFGVESGRLVVATKTKGRSASIEVMALP